MVTFTLKQNKEYRKKNYIRIINKRIQNYINNGCIGDLDLYNTPITKLPNNLKYIGGTLDIGLTNITELPKGLEIKKYLIISYTNIEELPDDILIEGNLWCLGTPLSIKYSKTKIKFKWNIKGYVRYI